MTKTMKKLLGLGILACGLMVAAPKKSLASDFQSSTFTNLFVSSFNAGAGTTAAGSFDLIRVTLSTGYNGPAYFVCYDTVPACANVGGCGGWPTQGLFDQSTLIFPPIPFIPSTATITGAPVQYDMRNTYGGGRSLNRGLFCQIYGDTVNRYWYTLEYDMTPLRADQGGGGR